MTPFSPFLNSSTFFYIFSHNETERLFSNCDDLLLPENVDKPPPKVAPVSRSENEASGLSILDFDPIDLPPVITDAKSGIGGNCDGKGNAKLQEQSPDFRRFAKMYEEIQNFQDVDLIFEELEAKGKSPRPGRNRREWSDAMKKRVIENQRLAFQQIRSNSRQEVQQVPITRRDLEHLDEMWNKHLKSATTPEDEKTLIFDHLKMMLG